jgi:hypothetical protein
MPRAGTARVLGLPEVSLRAREPDQPGLPRRPAEQLAPVLIAAARRAPSARQDAGGRPVSDEPRLELVPQQVIPEQTGPAAGDDPVAVESTAVAGGRPGQPVPPLVQPPVGPAADGAHPALPGVGPHPGERGDGFGRDAVASRLYVSSTPPRPDELGLDDTVVMELAGSPEPAPPAPVRESAPEPLVEPPDVKDRWWDGIEHPPTDWAGRPERRSGRRAAVLAGLAALGVLGAAGIAVIRPSVFPRLGLVLATSPAAERQAAPPQTTADAKPPTSAVTLERLESVEPESDSMDASPEPAPPAAAARQVAAPPTQATPSGGPFAVYLVSVRPASQVAVVWRQLVERYPELAGLRLRPTRPVEVPNVGTLYAVEAGGLARRADAQAVCDRLRAQDQSCRVLPP